MPKIGPYHIECATEFRVMEGSRIKARIYDLDQAIEWAEEQWSTELDLEEQRQYGDDRDGDIADVKWKMRREEGL